MQALAAETVRASSMPRIHTQVGQTSTNSDTHESQLQSQGKAKAVQHHVGAGAGAAGASGLLEWCPDITTADIVDEHSYFR